MSEQSERFGRMIGMLGSNNEGERNAALSAIDRALSTSGLSWGWLAELCSSGEPSDSGVVRARASIVARLLMPRLHEMLSLAFSLTSEELREINQLRQRVESGALSGMLASPDGLAQIDAALITVAAGKRRNGRQA